MVKSLKTIEKVFLATVAILFLVVFVKYFYGYGRSLAMSGTVFAKDLMLKCSADEIRLKISGGHICRPKDLADSVWQDIYDKYPKSAKGKESIYSFLSEGSVEVANKYLAGVYQVDRYEDLKIEDEITWEEDPYNEKYWRFMFYSLRQTRHLLYAGNETKNPDYYNKLKEILASFSVDGINKEQSWEDDHAAAFRSMVLVNSWYKLREQDQLPADLSEKILKAIKIHGDFLYDEKNYQPSYNHGVNQASALLVMAINFPELDTDSQWLEMAKYRLRTGVSDIVDSDGVLVENSPYYHFYTLEKYWQIYKYTKDYNILIDEEFEDKINKMISYAVYVLHPNLDIPLMGASLERKINFSKEYKQIAEQNDNFLYVLTKGAEGKEPPKKSIYYPIAGQTIMRSDWGTGKYFENQTQIIFDVGPYRTTHSDLDALNFVLSSQGEVLIGDAGLFTYELNKYRDYFHGTRAHNTVVVDGKDQASGSAQAVAFVEGDGYVYQTAVENLNKGVDHSRAIVLLGNDTALVLDNLNAAEKHTYEQKFHLNPNATINIDNLKVSAQGGKTKFNIRQLVANGVSLNAIKGQEEPFDGWCSVKYEEKMPCYSISYKQEKTNAFFATLITIGDADKNVVAKIDKDNKNIEIKIGDNTYNINIETVLGKKEQISVVNNPVNGALKTSILSFSSSENWIIDSNQEQTNPEQTKSYFNNAGLLLVSSSTEAKIDKNIDLSHDNIVLRMKVDGRYNVNNMTMSLSNNNWSNTASYSLLNVYRAEFGGEWISISIGKSELRDRGGQWRFKNNGFDWSKIDSIKFKFNTVGGKQASVYLDTLDSMPEQKSGSVVFIFDDGDKTVLEAANVMKEYGIKGNIAVIADRPDANKNYLTLEQLKNLQNNDGWDMVNHSTHHRDALMYYFENDNLSGYEADVLGGLKYLEKNGINSAPNWYVYPHGATNSAIKKIIAKYHKFARITSNSSEVYPFGEPLGVKAFSVADNTSPEAVNLAIYDAKKYNLTLFLTFHKIKSSADNINGYPIENFKKIINNIAKSSVSVKTLSDLDTSNRESVNDVLIQDFIPSKIILNIKIVKNNIFNKIYNLIGDAFLFSFSDKFDAPQKLEEAGGMAESKNKNWWVNSGAFLMIENGVGKTLQGGLAKNDMWQKKYFDYNADETDNGYHPQNIFRLINKNKLLNYQQEAYFKIIKDNLSTSTHRFESNSILLFSRYVDQDNLYYAGLRVDGTAIIKKKMNGTYYTLASEKVFEGVYSRDKNPNLLPKNKWLGIKTEVVNRGAEVEIKLFAWADDDGVWKQVAQAVDDGKSFGGKAITSKGYSGIRTDFMDVEFDNYLLKEIR